jgi:hypothetical protein
MKVKQELSSVGRWRYVWFNHEGTTLVRQQRAAERAAAEKAAAAKAGAKKALLKSFATFTSGKRTHPSKIHKALKKKYDFKKSDADAQCSYCHGRWSTWVGLDLRTDKRKWRTTHGQPEMWFCGLQPCSKARVAEDKLRKTARAAAKAKKAEAAMAASTAVDLVISKQTAEKGGENKPAKKTKAKKKAKRKKRR